MDSQLGGKDAEETEQASNIQQPSPTFLFGSHGVHQDSSRTLLLPSFTFEASLIYPPPMVLPEFSTTDVPIEPAIAYPGYEADLEKLNRLEGDVEDLKQRYSDVQREVELLTQRDEQERGRAPQAPPTPPSPPTVDRKAELRRLRRHEDYKNAAAERAYNDAKHVENEIKRQTRRNEIEDRRRDWWDKNKGRAVSPPHPFPITPATTAQPLTSLTTTLAFRPTSIMAQSPWNMASMPISLPPPLSKIPLPSGSWSCSHSHSPSPERDATEQPGRVHNRPVPKGILRKTDPQRWDLPNPLRFVRFDEAVNVARFIDYEEDDNGESDDGM